MDKEKVKQWMEMAKQLAALKPRELALRKMLAFEVMGGDKVSGTKKLELEEMELTASVTESLALDAGDVLAIREKLTPEEKECIVWKPSIKKRDYDKLKKSSPLRRITVLKYNAPSLKVLDLEL